MPKSSEHPKKCGKIAGILINREKSPTFAVVGRVLIEIARARYSRQSGKTKLKKGQAFDAQERPP
jgi:hypothetical protein